MAIDYIQLAAEHIARLYDYVSYAQPPLMDLPPGSIIGHFAYSVPGKIRFILNRAEEIAPGVLPGDLARAWIKDNYPLPVHRRGDELKIGYSVPNYARIGKFGDCAYVDIKKAYARVLAMGWDVEYILGRYFMGEPKPVPPQIAANKTAYGIAISTSGNRFSRLTIMGREKQTFVHRPFNLFSNPCLFNLARETLNGIGSEWLSVLRDNVVYMNTDGVIVKNRCIENAIDIARSWGFEARIKENDKGEEIRGDTEIWGVGSYRVGDYATRRHDPFAKDFCEPLMSRGDRLWLKTRWYQWQKHIT